MFKTALSFKTVSMFAILQLLVLLGYYSFFQNLSSAQDSGDTLVLLHVIFRHGDRTPNRAEVYPKDPYFNFTYPPLGYGVLTEAGKQREVSIGRTLRNDYYHYFKNVQRNEVDAITTDYNRTKLSCQLVLVGLLSPPGQNLDLPDVSECYFQKKDKDQLLGDAANYCPEFEGLYEEQSTKLKGLDIYNANKLFYDYILYNTGWTSKTPSTASELYYMLQSQDNLGMILPNWTKSVWPTEMSIRGADQYQVYTGSTKMKRISTGHLLQKIIDDTKKSIRSNSTSDTKLFLYSGHDFNVAFLLIILEQFKPHVPTYGAYLTLEVHNINGEYGFKIWYNNYSKGAKKEPLNVNGCGFFCPVDKFKESVSKYLPVSGECGIL